MVVWNRSTRPAYTALNTVLWRGRLRPLRTPGLSRRCRSNARTGAQPPGPPPRCAHGSAAHRCGPRPPHADGPVRRQPGSGPPAPQRRGAEQRGCQRPRGAVARCPRPHGRPDGGRSRHRPPPPPARPRAGSWPSRRESGSGLMGATRAPALVEILEDPAYAPHHPLTAALGALYLMLRYGAVPGLTSRRTLPKRPSRAFARRTGPSADRRLPRPGRHGPAPPPPASARSPARRSSR